MKYLLALNILFGCTLLLAQTTIDPTKIEPGEKASGLRERKAAQKNYDPSNMVIDRWLFPVRMKLQTISNPPGLKYRDMGSRTDRTDIFAAIF